MIEVPAFERIWHLLDSQGQVLDSCRRLENGLSCSILVRTREQIRPPVKRRARPHAISSALGTAKTVKARFCLSLVPFLMQSYVNPLKLFQTQAGHGRRRPLAIEIERKMSYANAGGADPLLRLAVRVQRSEFSSLVKFCACIYEF